MAFFGFFHKNGTHFNNFQAHYPHLISQIFKSVFWFLFGAVLGFFFFVSFLFIIYQKSYTDRVYLGIFVDGIDFSGKTKAEVQNYFANKNQTIGKYTLVFSAPTATATISAAQIDFGYDAELLAEQAFSIGRSQNQLSNLSLLFQSYLGQIRLPASLRYSGDKLAESLLLIKQATELAPENALFTFENGRVSAFSLSKDGRAVDVELLQDQLYEKLSQSIESGMHSSVPIKVTVPIKVLKPSVTTENANSLGIRERIGEGTSLFYHSIPNRIYNVALAAGRLNGLLIQPGEVFSFNKALGDISAFTGYKQAYVIENGRTVLGDGGGVCQVSTTLFRAALQAGLPIVERHPHAYRVGYYEQDSGPGVDASVFSPSVDLKFKNDTGHHILVQSYADTTNLRLTFHLYGTSDGREVAVGEPVILSQSSAPEPLYQDDPTLPKGVVKQVDFAAGGAKTTFTRSVKKDGKEIIFDKFVSNYRPWQAVFLRGTKE